LKRLSIKKNTELFAIKPAHLKQIKRQFTSIHHSFAGNVKELTSQIEKLQRDCKDKDTQIKHIKESHTWALKDKDRIIEVKDCTIKLKDKDIEVLKLKNQLMHFQINK
jgi:transcriptional regulator with AAA-type ATPase domain